MRTQQTSRSPSKDYMRETKASLRKAVRAGSEPLLLNTKHTLNGPQLMDKIKNRRVKSYRKISFNIRKMDQIFKGPVSADKGKPSSRQQSGYFPFGITARMGQEAHLNPKNSIRSNPAHIDSGTVLKTCHDFYDKQKSNVISRGDLLPSQLPFVKRRMATQVSSPQRMIQLEKELIDCEQPEEFTPVGIKNLKRHRQQKVLASKKGVPGLEFHKNQQTMHFWNRRPAKNDRSSNSSDLTDKSRSFYFHIDDLLSKDKSQCVEEMYQLRGSKELHTQPKQWHFYNCLKLSQISLYSTKLPVSCDQWLLIDYLQLKYLRGYNPKTSSEFSSLISLVLAAIVIDLEADLEVKVDKVQVKINNDMVESKIQQNRYGDRDFTLPSKTLISVKDLLKGVLYTQQIDLTWHLIYALAYIYQKFQLGQGNQTEKDYMPQYDRHIYLQPGQNDPKKYEKMFLALSQQVFSRLNLQNDIKLQSKVKKVVNYKDKNKMSPQKKAQPAFRHKVCNQYLLIEASCVAVAILFMDCLRSEYFCSIFASDAQSLKSTIRFPLGFRHWESRNHLWNSLHPGAKRQGLHCLMGSNVENKFNNVIVYNSKHKTIVVCNDSRNNMALRDVEGIERWMSQTFQRFKQ